MKAVIFDIDGTLADLSHRLHHVSGKPKNWDAFFAEADRDALIVPMRDLAQMLAAAGTKIIGLPIAMEQRTGLRVS